VAEASFKNSSVTGIMVVLIELVNAVATEHIKNAPALLTNIFDNKII
jgi:hypothetical protein